MAVYIQNIATAVPEHHFEQSFLREKMKEYVSGQRASEHIIHRIYSNSGIEKRHTVVNDFRSNGHSELFFKQDGILGQPSTKKRNDLYAHYAKNLFVDVARKLLQDDEAPDKNDITHVITVSCTGFFAPEPAYEIVKQLNLPPSTERFHVGFMGCFAVFPALKMAQSFCEANPQAKVMIVSVELCSLHLQASDGLDQLISASVFADGAAGVLVQKRDSPPQKPSYRIEQFQTAIAGNSEEDMAWTIGDTGFDMVLSNYVPKIIDSNLQEATAPLFDAYGLVYDEVPHWAIHPGGRAILDKIEKNIHLQPQQLKSSRQVLANYGNMSSATILFVLQDLLAQPAKNQEERVLSMTFGPGLTIESALFSKLR